MSKINIIEKKETNAVFDVTKYILSIMVIAIHSNLFPSVLYPWLRLAVPLFFIISSYFLFKKLENTEDSKKDGVVWRYVKRNAILYLFWFIVLLPISLYLHHDIWIDDFNIFCLLRFLRSLVFASTFPASWYISATIIGTIIVYFLSKKFGNKLIILISCVFYILACLVSSYQYIVDSNQILSNIVSSLKIIIPAPYNSFLVALFWIVCGKCIAESRMLIRTGLLTATLILSAVLLELEFQLHVKVTGNYNNDLYFMLIPLSICIFISLCKIPAWKNKYGVTFRKLSTLYYVMHSAVLDIIMFVFINIVHFENNILYFILTLFIVTGISVLIIAIAKTEHLKIFKYSY